jgi:limonene-1,2-epoxide hydrolase
MTAPIDVLKAFIGGMSGDYDQMAVTFNRYFTAESVWENVGVVTARGIQESIDCMRTMEDHGVTRLKIEVLAMAADGDTVLVERVDHMLKADGSEFGAFRVVGVFDVQNDKVLGWRDYFDTAGMLSQQWKDTPDKLVKQWHSA